MTIFLSDTKLENLKTIKRKLQECLSAIPMQHMKINGILIVVLRNGKRLVWIVGFCRLNLMVFYRRIRQQNVDQISID